MSITDYHDRTGVAMPVRKVDDLGCPEVHLSFARLLGWRHENLPVPLLEVPDDRVILTLACGEYRFNKLDFGDVGGTPHLLDMGQGNDAYSAIQVAMALAKAFGCGVNDLPLSTIINWHEQKAVCILLTLLHLGIKNIRLGPSLPAFITQNALAYLSRSSTSCRSQRCRRS